jgi:hypothetical protein
MGVLAAVTGVLFWFAVRKLDRAEEDMNNLKVGHVTADARGIEAIRED